MATVRFFPVRWRLRRPFVTALGRKEWTENVVVRVELSGGAEGYGEASSSLAMASQTQARMAAALGRLGRRFLGRDVRDVDWEEGWRAEPGCPAVVGALECAAADAWARAEGVPMFRFWGRGGRELETLMSVSAVAPAQVAARVREGRRRDFRAFKLKLNGAEPLAVNRDRLRAARGAAPRARLLIDPNQSYLPAGLAALLDAAGADGVEISLIEEPFPKQDWRVLSTWRRPRPPVILDESIQTPADARLVRRRRLAHGVNVKLAKSGLSRSLAILEAFRGRVPRMIGCMAESPVGLSAAVHFASGVGAFDFADLDSDLLLAPTGCAGGYIRRGRWIRLPKDPPPGLGFSWKRGRREAAGFSAV